MSIAVDGIFFFETRLNDADFKTKASLRLSRMTRSLLSSRVKFLASQFSLFFHNKEQGGVVHEIPPEKCYCHACLF